MKSSAASSLAITLVTGCWSIGSHAQVIDTVNLGELPSNTVSVGFSTSYLGGVASADGRYSSSPQDYGGTGPVINGVVTASSTLTGQKKRPQTAGLFTAMRLLLLLVAVHAP
jgi:hypothetical protein